MNGTERLTSTEVKEPMAYLGFGCLRRVVPPSRTERPNFKKKIIEFAFIWLSNLKSVAHFFFHLKYLFCRALDYAARDACPPPFRKERPSLL
jgi:hypothetical protein